MVGPAMMRQSSRTLMPLRIFWLPSGDGGNLVGGMLPFKGVTLHGDSFTLVCPCRWSEYGFASY